MNHSVESKCHNNIEDNDGETNDYTTCPLLLLKYSRPKKPITSRLGQKLKSLKLNNDTRSLFENKTIEANSGNSFKICTPKKLINDFDKCDLVNDTQFAFPAVKTQNNSDIETSNDTFINLNRIIIRKPNFRTTLPLSTKRSLYSNKENILKQTKDEVKTSDYIYVTQNTIDTSPCCSLAIKKIIKENAITLSDDVKNGTCYTSPEISSHNYDTSSYHSIKETTNLAESPYSYFSIKNSDLQLNSSPIKLECQPLNGQLNHVPLEMSLTTKQNNCIIHTQSPTSSTSIQIVQKEEFKQPITLPNSLCIKCTNENFIFVNELRYSILNTLGHGGSSIVYEVLHPITNQVVAVKKVDLSEVENMIAQEYLNEVNLLKNLQDCESVIRLFDSQYTSKEKILYMVMEKGDIAFSKLTRCTKNMSVHMIMYYWSEMLITVNEIHTRGVIHSDLKPANFLLVRGHLKLIDFGIASKIPGDMTSVLKDVTTGTWNYMSPECIKSGGSSFKGHKINQKSDVWSLGCILYSLIYGKTPYSHYTNTWQKLQAIAESKQNISFPKYSNIFPEGIPPVLQQTMELCLKKDVKARPYVTDLLKLIEITVFKPNE